MNVSAYDKYDFHWEVEQEAERGMYPLTPRTESFGYALYLDRLRSKPITFTHIDRCWCDAWKPLAKMVCFQCDPEGRKSWDGGENV